MASSSINSLKHVETSGIKQVFDLLSQKDKRFTQLISQIDRVTTRLKGHWSGPAADEFATRYNVTYEHVCDIGSTLTDIAKVLKDVYVAFEEADHNLASQLKEAAYNSKKGGGSSSDGGSTMSKRPELLSTMGEAYLPNMSYPALPAKPILHSTMGAAYNPDLSYAAMSQKPVCCSCLPGMVMTCLCMNNMSAKDNLSSTTGDAIQTVIDWAATGNADSIGSVIGSPYMPDLSFNPLARVADLSSTMGDAYVPQIVFDTLQSVSIPQGMLADVVQFMQDYSGGTPYMQQVKNTLIANEVNSLALQAAMGNISQSELITKMGEAVMSKIYGNLTDAQRATMTQIVGASLYSKMYGSVSNGPQDTYIPVDSQAMANMTSAVNDVVAQINPKPAVTVTLGAAVGVEGLTVMANTTVSAIIHPAAAEGVLQRFTEAAGSKIDPGAMSKIMGGAGDPGAMSKIMGGAGVVIGTTGNGLGTVDPGAMSKIMGGVGMEANKSAVEQLVAKQVSIKCNASVGVVTQTTQVISGRSISFTAGKSLVSDHTVTLLASGGMDSSAMSNLSQVANQCASRSVVYNTSAISFPGVA